MSTTNEIKNKIAGHRAAIREHIAKYNNYPYAQDKEFALKTIRRVQKEISQLKNKANVNIDYSWEDDWSPN